MAKEQICITLDDYHKWAIQRIADTMHDDRTAVIARAVIEWVARYPDTVAGAKATLADFAGSEEGKSTEWKTRKGKKAE